MNGKIDFEVELGTLRLKMNILNLQSTIYSIEWFLRYFIEEKRYCRRVDVSEAYRNYTEGLGNLLPAVQSEDEMPLLIGRMSAQMQWETVYVDDTSHVLIRPHVQKKSE